MEHLFGSHVTRHHRMEFTMFRHMLDVENLARRSFALEEPVVVDSTAPMFGVSAIIGVAIASAVLFAVWLY